MNLVEFWKVRKLLREGKEQVEVQSLPKGQNERRGSKSCQSCGGRRRGRDGERGGRELSGGDQAQDLTCKEGRIDVLLHVLAKRK